MKAPPNSVSVESMLRERIGFGAYPSGILARCLNRRMKANGIDDEAAYLSFLFSNNPEQEELIEEIIVPETWFFRDYEPFVYLKEYVAEKRCAFSAQAPLSALSVPASTGEEPYSIAIALMEAGLMPDQFCVHAADVSRMALRKAGEALYGVASFRENYSELRRKYFDRVDSMFLVRPEVRRSVRFMHANVLENALGLPESHDVVFFRNLLIYLDEENRKVAIQNVERVLKRGGLLVLGYAEPQQVFFPGFIPVDHPRSYASRKPLEKPGVEQKGCGDAGVIPLAARSGTEREISLKHIMMQPGESTPSPSYLFGKGKKVKIPNAVPGPAEELCAASPEETSGMLKRAREFADAGMLSAAVELSRECLKSNVACVEAYYLLAITALARGDEEDAATNLNKVIYLDPNHDDALFHLSLLMDRFGHKDQAARYRKRITRLGKETSPKDRPEKGNLESGTKRKKYSKMELNRLLM